MMEVFKDTPKIADYIRERQAAGVAFHRFANELLACFRAHHIEEAFPLARVNRWRLEANDIDAIVAEAWRKFPEYPARDPAGPRGRRAARHAQLRRAVFGLHS